MQPPPSPIAWVTRFLRPRRWRLAGVLLFSLVGIALGLGQPYLTKWLIDDGVLGGDATLLVGLAAGMVALGVLSSLFGLWTRLFYLRVSAGILFDLREAVYRHLQSLPPTFYARRSTGDLLSRIDGDVAEIQRFATDAPLAAVNAVLTLVGAVVLMAGLEPRLALLALVLVPTQFLFLRWLRPRIERSARALRERAAAVSAFLVGTLGSMKLVQAAGAEAREAERLAGLNQAYLDVLLRAQVVNAAAAGVPAALNSAGNAAVFVLGGLMVIGGNLTLGTLIAFTAYLGRATGPVQTLLGLYAGAQTARVSLGRVMELLAEASAAAPPAVPVPLPADAAGAVRIDGVAFAYDPACPVLRGASLSVPAGAKVGIVGVSGAGKSTLLDLLHRHYDPQTGRITLDGVDLRDLDLAQLRRCVAVLAQDAPLLAGSIRDNIRYGAAAVSEDRIQEAVCAARLDAFVAALPAGLDTPVGERGAALSGGQRQRIALARALLADPLVLVLDEPVSGVDAEAAAQLTAAVDRLFAGRTRIVVSHRPEALAGADAVWELRGGRFVPAGVPAEAAP